MMIREYGTNNANDDAFNDKRPSDEQSVAPIYFIILISFF